MHCTIRFIDCTKTQWWHNFFLFLGFVSFYFVIISFFFFKEVLSFVSCFISRPSHVELIAVLRIFISFHFGFFNISTFYWLIWRTPRVSSVVLRREENEKRKTVRSHIWKWLDHMSCFCVCCVCCVFSSFFLLRVFFVCI